MPIPSISRGVLIFLSPNAKNAEVSATNPYFIFQYNPEKLLHTFNQPAPSEVPQPQKLLEERFNLSFELDCTDLEPQAQNQTTADFGIHPALAMLETMMQPQIVANKTVVPIVIFNWGLKRSVPVQLVSMSVEEIAFDILLNPIRAIVNLTLRVLDALEVDSNMGARNAYINHQAVRAALVEAYKLQTGQAPSGGKVTGASTISSKAASAKTESKAKIGT